MKSVLKKINSAARFLNPLKNFILDEIPFEIRFDPLTGETGRVFNIPYKPEKTDLTETIRRSEKLFCPFCPEALEKSTPLFPADIILEGRIQVGRASLIPNLAPFDKYAAVSILSPQHYIPMEDLLPSMIQDAFIASQVFIKRIAERDASVRFFSINWNYMPPSGSSMVHPHLQPNCGEMPTNELRRQLEGCRHYRQVNHRSFWKDYIEEEKAREERYLGEIGPTFWAMSFVPLGFLPDAWCIFPDDSSLSHLTEDGLTAFLQGLSKILQYFHHENIYSFNLSLFSVRDDADFRMNARIVPRLFPRAIGNNDMAYFQAVHKESFTVRSPESVCQRLRESFKGG